MKGLLLSQPLLNKLAKTPEGKAELNKRLREGKRLRDNMVSEHEKGLAKLNALLNRIQIALGEVEA
ncbi:MAG: hypothetical protein JSR63_07560 [Proteobacteria bacterium]|nr:hypothetical protein [Pseudomonadota bacterium]